MFIAVFLFSAANKPPNAPPNAAAKQKCRRAYGKEKKTDTVPSVKDKCQNSKYNSQIQKQIGWDQANKLLFDFETKQKLNQEHNNEHDQNENIRPNIK